MKTLLLIFSTLATIAISCKKSVKPQIIQFTTYTKEVDSSVIWKGRNLVYYNFFFLVKNYSTQKQDISIIDSFATNFLTSGKFSPNKEEVRLWFYKETAKTNIEAIRANPREVDRYSNEHDLVWGFTLQKNNFLRRKKFKDGEVIETNSIKIDPAPKFRIEKVE
ncbi:MAG: hypothetical protein ACOYLO_06555 [Ferruginibacter sp.]